MGAKRIPRCIFLCRRFLSFHLGDCFSFLDHIANYTGTNQSLSSFYQKAAFLLFFSKREQVQTIEQLEKIWLWIHRVFN